MAGKYWDEQHESMTDVDKKALQFERMKRQIQYVYDRIPFYRQLFDKFRIKPTDLKALKDIMKFPFTLKKDLSDNYPFGMSAVEKGHLVRIHASSGTTGKPGLGFYTEHDLDQWTECMARGLWAQEDTAGQCFPKRQWHGTFHRWYGISPRSHENRMCNNSIWSWYD